MYGFPRDVRALLHHLGLIKGPAWHDRDWRAFHGRAVEEGSYCVRGVDMMMFDPCGGGLESLAELWLSFC